MLRRHGRWVTVRFYRRNTYIDYSYVRIICIKFTVVLFRVSEFVLSAFQMRAWDIPPRNLVGQFSFSRSPSLNLEQKRTTRCNRVFVFWETTKVFQVDDRRSHKLRNSKRWTHVNWRAVLVEIRLQLLCCQQDGGWTLRGWTISAEKHDSLGRFSLYRKL